MFPVISVTLKSDHLIRVVDSLSVSISGPGRPAEAC